MSGEEPYDYSGPKEQLHLTPEQLLHKVLAPLMSTRSASVI